MTRLQLALKRAFDVPIALVGLSLMIVPIGIIALLVKLSSVGPVFYRQTRVGRRGRHFECIKFRTMYPDADKQGPVTTTRDDRITSFGRILRRFKLDELPQLWNVLVGHMSFVGPRPDVPGYADRLQGKDRRLLELYPGITGPATLRFRDEETLLSVVAHPQRYNDEVLYPEKVKINLAYLDNWSFWKDMGYILQTIAPGASQQLGIVRRLGLTSEPLSPAKESDDDSHLF